MGFGRYIVECASGDYKGGANNVTEAKRMVDTHKRSQPTHNVDYYDDPDYKPPYPMADDQVGVDQAAEAAGEDSGDGAG